MAKFATRPEKKVRPVTELTDKNFGGLVVYRDEGIQELGRIKDFSNDRDTAYVVFEADGHWGEKAWLDYTAVACDYSKLTLLLK